MRDIYSRREEVSTYYLNCACDLHAAALVVGHAIENPNALPAARLGLGLGFSYEVALSPPFRMFAGLSIELILKAIAKALNRPELKTHDLVQLICHVGIDSNEDQKVILDLLTEAIVWGGRYPVPLRTNEWDKSKLSWSKTRIRTSSERFNITSPLPSRWPSMENYSKIWELLHEHYWIAKNSKFEQ